MRKDLKEYIKNQNNEKLEEAYIKVFEVVDDNIPSGFEFNFGYGIPGYDVPFSAYPDGYHCTPTNPLPFLGVALQKHHIALYHMGIYMDDELNTWFKKEYEDLNIGKLDMGKSCIRFKNPKKVPYELIGQLVSKMQMKRYIELYEQSIGK